MTQPIDEHRLEMGFYVIGVFDVLGQRRRLLRPMTFPPTTEAEEQLVRRNLLDTVVPVDRFRQLFQRQLDERAGAFEDDATRVPEAERAEFRAAMAPNMVSWGFSDTYCVAIPLTPGTGATGAMATMANVRRLLEVTAVTWLASLAENDPIRGGVEIGTATRMRESDVYGAALVEAHRIESKVAGRPRIVVGEDLVAALRDVRRDPDVRYRGAARFATDCWSMLRRESDGHMALDVLGSSWARLERRQQLRDLFDRAHDNVCGQLEEHRRAGDRTLIERYGLLLAYFDDHFDRWRS